MIQNSFSIITDYKTVRKSLPVPIGIKIPRENQAWWHTPLVPACGRQRQVDLYVFKVIYIVYRACSRTAGPTLRNPVSNKTKQNKKKPKKNKNKKIEIA